MKKLIAPIIIAVIAIWIGISLVSNKKEMTAQAASAMEVSRHIPVQTQTVTQESYALSFVSNGIFQADKELSIQSEASGKVIKVFKKKGQFVTAGEPIVKLDDEMLQAELSISEIKLKQAEKDLARYHNLSETEAITSKQLEESQNALEMIKAELKTIRKRLSNTLITAPISGYINEDYVEIGTLINPGMPVADLVSTDPMKLSIKVSEAEIVQIGLGDKVGITVGALPDEKMEGKVTFTSSKADASLHYIVEIDIQNAHKSIRPGMFGSAEFSYQMPEIIQIPRQALIGGLRDPEVYLFQNGKANKRKITARSMGQDKIAVMDGLNIGDKIITSGLINLREGVEVIEL
ncbi:efflux RND transporter periplasmic adaptor subunit [Anditalea andensis]|uniref:RND transporter n=1 Tax=Anditalea andensis TaxID=1048983 RepID=A0A074L113_9BACT|nr:efflux RND transporter periplasmic adaptor subunit [Anditalea andensis]KEO74145.1 RND transporter [Anditalea andensis]